MKIRVHVAAAVAVLALTAGCTAGAPAAVVDDKVRPAESSAAATPSETPSSAPAAASSTPSAAPGSSEPAATDAVPDLAGSTWAGTDSDGDAYVYRFEAGGQYAFTSPSGSYQDPGDTWSQSGDQVTMSTSGGYATYTGTIQGDTVSGTASNISGHSWTWTADRQQ